MNERTSSTRLQFAWNVLYTMGAQVVTSLVTFFSSPYIVHKLGDEAYGVLVLIGVILGYLGILDLGLSTAATKYLSECFSENNLDKARRILWSSLLTYLIIGLIGGALLFSFSPYLVKQLLNVSPNLQRASILAFRISAIGFAAGLIANTFRAVLHAQQCIHYLALAAFLIGAGQPALVVLLLSLGHHLVSAAIATASLSVITALLTGVLAYRIYPGWGKPLYDSLIIRQLLRFGSWMTLASLVVPLLLQVEKIFLSQVFSPAEVTYYAIGVSLVMRIPPLIYGAFATSLFPIFSGYEAKNLRLIQWGIRLPFFMQLPALLFFLAFGQGLMLAWMGPSFAEKSTPILWITSAAAFINGLAIIPHTYLLARGKPDLVAKFYLLEALIYVPLSYLLITSLGLIGAALAYLVRISLDALLLIYAAKRLLGHSWLLFLKPALHPLTLTLLSVSIALLIEQYCWQPLVITFKDLVIASGAFIGLVGITIGWGVFSQEERKLIANILLRR